MIEMRTRMRRRAIGALVIGFAWALPAPAQIGVESLPLAAAYGTGVHAYFSGDYDRTVADLGAIIAAGSRDPRALYFRGLALLRLGRMEEAEADFSDGADLETRDLGTWPVSRSLERVQGADRLQLERHRVRARVAMVQRDRDAVRARQEAADAAQPDVARERRPVPALPSDSTESNPFTEGDGDEPAANRTPADRPADPPASESNEAPAGEASTDDVNTPAEPRADDAADATPPAEEEMKESAPEGDGDAAAPGASDPFGDAPAPDAASTPAEKLPDDAPPAADTQPEADDDEPAPADDAPVAGAEDAAGAAAGDPEMEDAAATEPAADEAAEGADAAEADEAEADEAEADEAEADEAEGLGTESAEGE